MRNREEDIEIIVYNIDCRKHKAINRRSAMYKFYFRNQTYMIRLNYDDIPRYAEYACNIMDRLSELREAGVTKKALTKEALEANIKNKDCIHNIEQEKIVVVLNSFSEKGLLNDATLDELIEDVGSLIGITNFSSIDWNLRLKPSIESAVYSVALNWEFTEQDYESAMVTFAVALIVVGNKNTLNN